MAALGGLVSLWLGAASLHAGDVTVEVQCQTPCAPLSGPLVVHISTQNPDIVDSPMVLVSSMIAAPPGYSGPSSTLTVTFPMLNTNTTYYIWAFHDTGAGGGISMDQKPNGTEPMGGFGPFPHPGSGPLFLTGNVTHPVNLVVRGMISGSVTNQSAQAGRVLVEARPNNNPPELAYLRRKKLTDFQTGSYILDGLMPSSTAYIVQAFVDKNNNFNPDFDEDKSPNSSPMNVTAGSSSTVNVAISNANSDVQGSTPDHIGLKDEFGSWSQTIAAGGASSDLRVDLLDFNGTPTISSNPVAINLFVSKAGVPFTFRTSATSLSENGNDFALTSSGGAPLSSSGTVISSGTSSSLKFKFLTRTSGLINLQAEAADFPTSGQSRYAYYDLNVLGAGSGFSNLSAVTNSGTPASGASITITPDYDGKDDSVQLSAAAPDANGNWELLVSKLSFSSAAATSPENVIWRQGGFGSSARGDWYGQDQTNEWRTVANGDYFARFQTSGGGITSTETKVTVQTSFIKGTVTSGGNPVEGADVNVWGPNSGGYSQTDSAGKFFVAGLKSGQLYFVNVTKPGFANFQQSNVSAGSELIISVGKGAILKLHADLLPNATNSFDVWGGVFVRNADYTSTAFGPIRIRAGETGSDNGRWPGTPPAFTDKDPEFSTNTLVGVLPNTSYTVELNLQQFGRQTTTFISAGEGQISTITFSNIERKANVFGLVRFQNVLQTPYGGEWVSVDATKKGDNFPTVFGGAWIQNGQAAATYNLFGLEGAALTPVEYTIRAFARGFKTLTRQVTVVGDRFDVDFSTFQEGGKISGTLRIIGDSTSVGGDTFFAGGCPISGQVPVFINAWSPTSFGGSFAQACITPSPTEVSVPYELKGLDDGTYDLFTFLEGFQLDPPVFPIRVTVSGGNADNDPDRNITFRSLTGAVNLTVNLKAGHPNPTSVQYFLNSRGPDGRGGNGFLNASGRAQITGLGTGLYELSLIDGFTGLQKRTAVSVTNGRTTDVTVSMDEDTFTISGTVSMQGSISISTGNTTVVISSVSYMAEKFAPAPVVQVFAFPLPEQFHGDVQPYAARPTLPDGSFTINGLVPGTYLIRVNNELLTDSSSLLCGTGGCPPAEVAFPEFATTQEVVFVNSSVTGKNLTITNGAKLSGTISRPSGDTSKDLREFTVELRRADNLEVWRSSVTTSGTGTASYSFPHLSAADYIVNVWEKSDFTGSRTPKYVSKPKRVTMTTSDLVQNITLLEGGVVVGKLRDADSQTLLTSDNAKNFLPDNFFIHAQANPWIPGGFAQAERDFFRGGAISISSTTNQFSIFRLIPDTTYDVNFRGFEDLGQQSAARGQKAYAPFVKSGVQVAKGQTVDIGLIDLKQGVNISGTVKDTAGIPLANIQIEGLPSLENGGDRHQFSVRAFTNDQGQYNLQGIDREKLYYDVVAAPRFEAGDIFSQLSGKKYGEETAQMIDVTDADARTGVDFELTEANGSVSGKVVTADGGALELPSFGGEGGEFADRRAVVFLHQEGAALTDNPLGEIEEVTDPQGNFRIDALKPGTYRMLVISVGYVTHRQNLVVTQGGLTNAGRITLQKGATLKGTIVKPNGESPNQSEVSLVVGVDEDFEDFIFAKLTANSDTKQVTGYELTGFRTGVNYFMVIVTENDEIIEAASDITFGSSGETKTQNIVFRPSPPAAYAVQARSGNRYTLRFITTQKVRNLTAEEQAGTSFVTCTSCAGAIVSQSISSSRDVISVVYDAAANEKSFKMRLAFTSIQENSDTGDNFAFEKEYKFFAGAARMRVVQIPNVIGGKAILEGDPTGGTFTSGNFDVSRSSRVEVGVVSAATLDDLSDTPTAPSAPGARARGALTVARSLGAEAYPSAALYNAVQQAPSVNPFSAFYDIFLPAGVSRSLKKDALLTLQYDASVTDPSNLNVYYFDDKNNVFLLENNKRKIDTKNRTITVAVNHASTFVVLNNNAAVVGSNTYAGTEILIHNFPNPFNLKTKNVTLSKPGSASPTQTIEGTMVRLALPAGLTGTVEFEIFNVAGELARKITESAPTGGTYYYIEWDGRNDGGKKVASGVYLARFTLNGGNERMFKMAVIK